SSGKSPASPLHMVGLTKARRLHLLRRPVVLTLLQLPSRKTPFLTVLFGAPHRYTCPQTALRGPCLTPPTCLFGTQLTWHALNNSPAFSNNRSPRRNDTTKSAAAIISNTPPPRSWPNATNSTSIPFEPSPVTSPDSQTSTASSSPPVAAAELPPNAR